MNYEIINIYNFRKIVFAIIAFSLVIASLFILNNPHALAVTAPVWHTSDQKTNNDDSTTANVDKPDNLNSGDLVIVLLHLRERPGTLSDAPNIVVPSGFNLIRAEGNTSGNSRAWVLAYYKIAGGDEPSNYSFTLPSSINWFAISGRVTNYNTQNPIGGHSGANSDETRVISQEIPSFDNQDDNSLLVASLTVRDDETDPSDPSEMNNIYSMISSVRDLLVRGATQEINSGDTGTRTFSWNREERAAALMFSIKPLEASTTGSIIVTKTTIGGDDTFSFKGEGFEEFEIETQDGTGSYTIDNLEPGTYTIEENVLEGWDKTQDTCQDVTVVAGQTDSCEITNTKWTTITGIKFDDVNDNGQRDESEPGLENWGIELRKVNNEPVSDISIDTELVQLSLTGQDGSFNLHTITSGHYIVTERNQEGWQNTYPVDSFFDIFVELSGQEINQGSVGHLNNQASISDPQVPLEFGNFNSAGYGDLVVIKVVSGSEISSSSWQIHVKQDNNDISGSPQSGQGGEGTTYNNITTGEYTISETDGPTGYIVSFSGDCNENGTVNIENGQTKTCTITNTKAANLIVKKIVINDNGGTKTASDFSFQINGGAAVSFDVDGQNDVSEPNGTYTVTETSASGYSTTYENCSEITLESGQEKTCTITNDDVQPKLTVTKVVINDNGQNKVVEDFPLFVNQTSVISGVQNGFNAGTYTISETSQTNYSSSIGGDCALDGSITLNVGDIKSCTITNNDIAQATPNVSGGSSGGGGGGGGATVQAFTIISSAGPNGSITPSGSLSVTNGNYTFTITPNAGFSVADVLVDGVSVGPVTTYTFNGVTASRTISASFSETPQIAGASTGPAVPSENPPSDASSSPLPNPVPSPTDSSSGQNTISEGSTASDNETGETSTENNQISPETETDGQLAAISGATGLEIFWNWIKANWPWLLLLIIILLILYWWWTQKQKPSKTNITNPTS